jgi:hypothetical protein
MRAASNASYSECELLQTSLAARASVHYHDTPTNHELEFVCVAVAAATVTVQWTRTTRAVDAALSPLVEARRRPSDWTFKLFFSFLGAALGPGQAARARPARAGGRAGGLGRDMQHTAQTPCRCRLREHPARAEADVHFNRAAFQVKLPRSPRHHTTRQAAPTAARKAGPSVRVGPSLSAPSQASLPGGTMLRLPGPANLEGLGPNSRRRQLEDHCCVACFLA